jgi:hypothetical protein
MWEGGLLGARKTTFNSVSAGRDSNQNGGKSGTTVQVHYRRRLTEIILPVRVPTLVKDSLLDGGQYTTRDWMIDDDSLLALMIL